MHTAYQQSLTLFRMADEVVEIIKDAHAGPSFC
jgi:hypothetical protein